MPFSSENSLTHGTKANPDGEKAVGNCGENWYQFFKIDADNRQGVLDAEGPPKH